MPPHLGRSDTCLSTSNCEPAKYCQSPKPRKRSESLEAHPKTPTAEDCFCKKSYRSHFHQNPTAQWHGWHRGGRGWDADREQMWRWCVLTLASSLVTRFRYCKMKGIVWNICCVHSLQEAFRNGGTSDPINANATPAEEQKSTAIDSKKARRRGEGAIAVF